MKACIISSKPLKRIIHKDVAGYRLQVAGYRLQVAGFNPESGIRNPESDEPVSYLAGDKQLI
jgi:hypothetical protein